MLIFIPSPKSFYGMVGGWQCWEKITCKGARWRPPSFSSRCAGGWMCKDGGTRCRARCRGPLRWQSRKPPSCWYHCPRWSIPSSNLCRQLHMTLKGQRIPFLSKTLYLILIVMMNPAWLWEASELGNLTMINMLTHEYRLGNSESTLFEEREYSKEGVPSAKTSEQCSPQTSPSTCSFSVPWLCLLFSPFCL